jgi:crotonobetainyl-CoA:carnitine CoA-transferase CaiB-like acyl-CoA transferase
MSRPLEGCRVLDLGIITAGAATSALLADLGAEVIKVESPGYRDPFRVWLPNDGEVVSDLPPFFRYTNRNKQGISLDLKRPEGREAFLRLAAESDVVLENFRRGVMNRMGIDYPAIRKLRSNIIFASLSSQGEAGPDANYVSYGTTLEAMSGLAWITGYADGGPLVSGKDLNYPDQVVAIFAAAMIATAWLQRKRTGRGAHLDISQRELTAFLIGETFLHPSAHTRRGNAEHGYAVQDCFSTSDGWVAVSVLAAQGPALAALLPAGAVSIDQRLRGWIGVRQREEVIHILHGAGIAAAPVLTGAEVLRERGRQWHFAIVDAVEGGFTKGFPFQLRRAPLTIARAAPHVGADTEQVLRDIGGYSDSEIENLIRSGVVECGAESPVSDPSPHDADAISAR